MNTALATPLNQPITLTGKVVLIANGAGHLGREHAQAVIEAGGTALIASANSEEARESALWVDRRQKRAHGVGLDSHSRSSCRAALQAALLQFGHVDILVNHADGHAERGVGSEAEDFEGQSVENWEANLALGLRGTFLCCQVFGGHMANNGGGVIINVSSDLDSSTKHTQIQMREAAQTRTPNISQSVIKGGIILMTRYLANYWEEENVRVNAICPAGVFAGQPEQFVQRLTNLIPLGRMEKRDEYRAALIFLATAASSYMTGTTLVLDGGRARR